MTHAHRLSGVCVALLLGGAACVAAQPRIAALSDVLGMEALDSAECPKTRVTGKGGAPLSLDQAVGNFNAALEGSVSPQAMRALEASKAWRDPALASRWAAAAIAADKPLAAAALAVRAQRLAPNEPRYLSNLAALANAYGRHDEALAMAGAAEPLAKGGASRANVLTNKANALIGLGRAQEAETVLKEAIKLQPDLSEAYTNMAYALGQQKRCPEAAKYLGAGGRRKPAETLNPPKDPEDAGKAAEDKAGKRSSARQEAAEEETHYLPAVLAFDLSRGKRGLLPKVPVPTSLEEAKAATDLQMKLQSRVLAEIAGMQGEVAKAQAAEKRRIARETKMADGTPSERLSAWRSRELRNAVGHFARDGRSRDPRLERLRRMMRDSHEQMRRADRRASDRAGEANEKALAKMVSTVETSCQKLKEPAAQRACQDRAKWEWEQARCDSLRRFIEERAAGVRAYDSALRTYFHESYLYATAAASYLGDADNQTWARFKLKSYELAFLPKALIHGAGPDALTDATLAMCKAPPPPEVPADAPANDVAFCVLPEGAKAKVGALDVVELAMNCEEVEVKLSTPGPVNLFIQVDYDKSERARKMADEQARKEEQRANRNPSNPLGLREFGTKGPERTLDGELTVFIGSGASTPVGPVEAEVKAGGFIKVGHYGGVVDFGARTETSITTGVSAGVVSVGVELEGPGGDVSFVSAPAPAR